MVPAVLSFLLTVIYCAQIFEQRMSNLPSPSKSPKEMMLGPPS